MRPATAGPAMAGRGNPRAETGDSWPDGEMAKSQWSELSKRERQAKSVGNYGWHHPDIFPNPRTSNKIW